MFMMPRSWDGTAASHDRAPVVCPVTLLALLIVVVPGHARASCERYPTCAQTFYVRSCGPDNVAECSDQNDGASPSTAWRSLKQAAAYVNGPLGNAGMCVIVGPGVYPDGDVDLERSGSFNARGTSLPISFIGDASGVCTGDAPGPVLAARSPAIDAGSADATLLALDQTTARADDDLDSGRVDLGFHGGSSGYPVLSTAPIDVQTVFVRSKGHDDNDGSTRQRAVRSIQRALSLSRAVAHIVVGSGSYDGPVVFNLTVLSPAGPVEFYADAAGELTSDNPGRVLVDGHKLDDTFNIIGRCSTVIDGFSVTGGSDNGIGIKQSHRSIAPSTRSCPRRQGLTGVSVAAASATTTSVCGRGARRPTSPMSIRSRLA